MEFITIKEAPEFSLDIQKWDRRTKANGTEMAENVITPMVNNEVYLKMRSDRQEHVEPVILAAGGWEGGAPPYTQTVAVDGITAEDNPLLVRVPPESATEAQQKAYNKAFGIISEGTGETGAGTVTFKVYKKPAVDITVGLKGV